MAIGWLRGSVKGLGLGIAMEKGSVKARLKETGLDWCLAITMD